MSVSAIYRLETAGRFPRRRRIGLRSVAWYESDIDEFIADPSAYRSDTG
ncbi:helix-turn-helix transcriptional regulator [Sphingobium sp. RAC03]|nr:AlpA family phage regulatory protein [Sphingobium sp. RAC03]